MLAGCGGQETPVEKVEQEAEVEEAEETTLPAPPAGQIEALRLECQARKAEADGFDVEALGTQVGEAIAAERFPESAPAPDPEIQQAVSEGKTIPDILEEAGYTCTDEEVRQLQAEAKEQAEQMQQKSIEAQKKSGKNAAGQDVSNIPEMSPKERRAEADCLRNYYNSLPPEQRGPESQRVVREANAQGVTPGAVVGC